MDTSAIKTMVAAGTDADTGIFDRSSDSRSAGPVDWGALLSRALAPFARVESREAVGVLLMAATVSLLLTSYYLLKIVREPLILLGGGAEVKSCASAGQACC